MRKPQANMIKKSKDKNGKLRRRKIVKCPIMDNMANNNL